MTAPQAFGPEGADPRVTPARPDLAASRLAGHVAAAHYVDGTAASVVAALAPLRLAPRPDASLHTEALRGETLTVYEDREGWAWVQLDHDASVGYLPSDALRPATPRPTHRVSALRSFVYPGPDLKMPPLDALSFGARVAIEGESAAFAAVAGGFVFAAHLVPVDDVEPDYVGTAERFLGTAYLWGGRSPGGIDCSGLVQLSLAAAGVAAPRDSDQQEAGLGSRLPPDAPLRRGDLVFWRGHVGIMRDGETLLHANGHAMTVTSEPLAEVRARREAAGEGPVTSLRRPAERGMAR